MPTFEYRATNADGQPVKGTLIGTSLTGAASELEGRGLSVEHLAAVPDPTGTVETPSEFAEEDITRQRTYSETHVVGALIGRVPLSDLLFFFRQLAMMLHAGVGMVQTLETLGRQTGNSILKSVLRELTEHAREGRPMSFGMQRYPEVFTPLMLSMVRVGEESGSLDSTLRYTADYIDREIKLRNLIRRQTMYPKVVIGASIVIILVANWIIAGLGGKGLASPLTSPATWVVLAPLIAGMWLFVRLGLPNPRVKHEFDEFVHRIPYLGTTVKMMVMAKFGRALAALYRGGVPLHRATLLAADACGSEAIRARLYPVGKRLEQGESLTTTFAETGAVDGIVLDMIQTGESTGNLDMMLDKMADFYEDDSETRANAMAMILGVVCLLLVAAYVLYVLVTFYSGYFGGLAGAGAE